MMRILYKIITLLVLATSVLYAKSVGSITALQGNALIYRDAKEVVATLGATLSEKDTILTKEKSRVQIIFDDETIITVGNKSSFSIEEYLFDESKTPSAKFGLASGAIRAITGKIGKIAPDRFSVKTKTATIGIRGTHFTVTAQIDGSSQVFCTFGAINVSSDGKTTAVTQGFFVSVTPDGGMSNPIKFDAIQLDKVQSDSFDGSQYEESFDSKKDDSTQSMGDSTQTNQSQDTPSAAISSTDSIAQLNITTIMQPQMQTTLPIESMQNQTTIAIQAQTADEVDEVVVATEEHIPPVQTPSEPEVTDPEPIEPNEPQEQTPEVADPEPIEPNEPQEQTPLVPDVTEPELIEPSGPQEQEPPSTEPVAPTPSQPTVVTFSTSGRAVAYKNNNEGYSQLLYNLPAVSSEINLKALSTSVFETTGTYIKITDYIDGFTWTFAPASTLTGTVSSGAFSGVFANASSTNTNISNINIVSSEFSITNDDLSTSDLMSWGEWNVDFTYSESGAVSNAKYSGLWVGGESITPADVIQSYTSSEPIEYVGIYKALLFSDSAIAAKSTGTATLSVDFGLDSATLHINDLTATGDTRTFQDMPISGSSFASQVSHSSANGTFYGAEGKDVAGGFSIMTQDYLPVAEGVYQVKTTQTPQ